LIEGQTRHGKNVARDQGGDCKSQKKAFELSRYGLSLVAVIRKEAIRTLARSPGKLGGRGLASASEWLIVTFICDAPPLFDAILELD